MSENPFVKAASSDAKPPAPKSEDKKDRKPVTPSIDLVIAAVDRGENDTRLIDLMTLVNGRKKAMQQYVMKQVHEVFGPDVEIVTKRNPSGATKARSIQ